MALIIFDMEWNIGYKPYSFNYHGVEQVLRGEIIQIGAVKVDDDGDVLDTFSMNLRPRIFRKLQHHIAKVTGLTQRQLDEGVPLKDGLSRFVRWCGPNARFGEWGMDDVPVLKQNLYLNGLDERWPRVWYDLQQVFEQQRPRAEGEKMNLEEVITRLGIPTDRPFHDALSDALYTADVCRTIDLKKGLESYPDEETALRISACPEGTEYREMEYFYGFLDKEAWRTDEDMKALRCPDCGAALIPEMITVAEGEEKELWMKKGNNSYYALCHCAGCHTGIMVRFKFARKDGLHWAAVRVLEMPNEDSLAKWEKQKKMLLERRKKKESAAEEGEAVQE